jgi:hypothetical protein
LGRIDRAFSRWVQSSTSNFSVILPVTLWKCFKFSVNHSFIICVVCYLILVFTSCFLSCVFYDHIQYVAEYLLFVLLVKIVLCRSVYYRNVILGFVNGHTLFFPTDSNVYPNQMTVLQLFIGWRLEMNFVVVIIILRVMWLGSRFNRHA